MHDKGFQSNRPQVKSAPSQNDLKMKVKIGHIFQIELIKNSLILYELKFFAKRLMYNLIFIDERVLFFFN